jgi:Putative peptidoglycan binding domain
MLARAAAVLRWIGLRLSASAARRPVDALALLAAGAASVIIIVNAVFLQSGARPAPFLANPAPRSTGNQIRTKLAEPMALDTADSTGSTEATAVPRGPRMTRRNDPIAGLIGSSSRIMAVQRALADFGYGQIKPTGTLDQPTSMAIEKFEREHNLPPTGHLSDRLISELAAMIGHPIR